MPHRSNQRTGFSLVELLVAIGIIVILLSILIPYVAKLRESDARVRCSDNLRAIHGALQAYSKMNGNNYPRVTYEPGRNASGYVAYSGAESPDPFARNTRVKSNDVTAALWLLVRPRLLEPSRFICPSTSDRAAAIGAELRSNFASGSQLSYSYSSPYSVAPGYKMNDTQPADFAIVADKSPGIAGGDNVAGPNFRAEPFDLARANSNNHRRAGQNVLYADGHVSFQSTPYCGVGREAQRDNIYTAYDTTPVAPSNDWPPSVERTGVYSKDLSPAWYGDSFLVPTDDE